MLISPHSAGLSAARALDRLDAPSDTPAKAVHMELLRSLLIVERLTQWVGAATADPIDQALETFWLGMVDDCVHRTGAQLAQHNHQRNLRHIEHHGGELLRQVEAMPPGAQRTQAQEKLTLFLETQRTQVEGQYQLDQPDQAVSIAARRMRTPGASLRSAPPADGAAPRPADGAAP